jgi:multidrug efflux system outer membrane protein
MNGVLRTGCLLASAVGMLVWVAGCTPLVSNYERPAAPIEANWPDQPKIELGNDKTATLAMRPVPASGAVHADHNNGANHGTNVSNGNGNGNGNGNIATAAMGWREFFLDPRLQALISLALTNSRDLRIAVQQVEEARAQWGQQKGQVWPSIGIGAQGQLERQPPDLRMPGGKNDAVTRQYQAGLGLLSFELDLFGRLSSLSRASYQQFLATEEAHRSVHISLIGTVAQAYLTLCAVDSQLALTRQVLAARQASYGLVRRRFEGGVATELDLEQSKSLLESATGQLAELARTQSQAKNALVLAVGASIPDDLPPPLPFGSAQMLTAIPAGLPSALLEQRPDIRGAEHALQAAHANIGAARAAFFPTISLTGLYGIASASLSGLWKGDTRFWSFSPSLTAPIFAGGSIQAGMDLAQARQHIAVAQYEQSIQQAFREVADALAGEATYAVQLKTLDALVASSSKTLALSNLRYTSGVDSYLQVQDAQVNAFNAQLSLLQTRLAALVNRVQFYKALGGGWLKTTQAQAINDAL